MEVIKRYPEIEELLFSIDRIANNLEQMTEIMTTTSVARPLPDWDPDKLSEELQDIKLENDRLQKRNDIMQHFIKSVRCKGLICEDCDLQFLNDNGTDLCAQVDHVRLESIASEILKKLEDL